MSSENERNPAGRDAEAARKMLPLDGREVEAGGVRWRIDVVEAEAFPDRQPMRYAILLDGEGDAERRFVLRIHEGTWAERDVERSPEELAAAVESAIADWLSSEVTCVECPDMQFDPVTGQLVDYAVGTDA